VSTANNIYSSIETNTREQVSLASGSYGTGKQPGLKILAYIEKASKLDKSGSMRHSFLVAATRPSREQLQQSTSNGKSSAAGDHPLDAPEFDGTAFLSMTLNDFWLAPESVALAFTEASRNKDGKVQRDHEKMHLEAGTVTEASLQKCRIHFQKIATDKVIAANTPEEFMAESITVQYRKELNQVSIKIGQFFDLQDWHNGGDKSKRDLQFSPFDLVGTEFSGKVEIREFNGRSGSEVTRVYSRD